MSAWGPWPEDAELGTEEESDLQLNNYEINAYREIEVIFPAKLVEVLDAHFMLQVFKGLNIF